MNTGNSSEDGTTATPQREKEKGKSRVVNASYAAVSCDECFAQKRKCEWTPGDVACRRCLHLNRPCKFERPAKNKLARRQELRQIMGTGADGAPESPGMGGGGSTPTTTNRASTTSSSANQFRPQQQAQQPLHQQPEQPAMSPESYGALIQDLTGGAGGYYPEIGFVLGGASIHRPQPPPAQQSIPPQMNQYDAYANVGGSGTYADYDSTFQQHLEPNYNVADSPSIDTAALAAQLVAQTQGYDTSGVDVGGPSEIDTAALAAQLVASATQQQHMHDHQFDVGLGGEPPMLDESLLEQQQLLGQDENVALLEEMLAAAAQQQQQQHQVPQQQSARRQSGGTAMPEFYNDPVLAEAYRQPRATRARSDTHSGSFSSVGSLPGGSGNRSASNQRAARGSFGSDGGQPLLDHNDPMLSSAGIRPVQAIKGEDNPNTTVPNSSLTNSHIPELTMLLNVYFDNISPHFEFIHRQSFFSSLATQPQYLLDSMCSLAVPFLPTTPGVDQIPKTLFQRASNNLVSIEPLPRAVTAVWTFMNLALHALLHESSTQRALAVAHGFHAMASSTAHSLRKAAHMRGKHPPSRDWVESEQRRRTWFSVWLIGTVLEAASGQRQTSAYVDEMLPVPCSDPVWRRNRQKREIEEPEPSTWDPGMFVDLGLLAEDEVDPMFVLPNSPLTPATPRGGSFATGEALTSASAGPTGDQQRRESIKTYTKPFPALAQEDLPKSLAKYFSKEAPMFLPTSPQPVPPHNAFCAIVELHALLEHAMYVARGEKKRGMGKEEVERALLRWEEMWETRKAEIGAKVWFGGMIVVGIFFAG